MTSEGSYTRVKTNYLAVEASEASYTAVEASEARYSTVVAS